MTDTPLTMQLHTMLLRVRRLDVSRNWYERKLGMTVIHEDVPYRLISLMGENDARLTIWELREGEIPTATSATTAYPVFRSVNARADHRALVARGVEATAPENTGLGILFFWITDPDGHRLCVLEFLPE